MSADGGTAPPKGSTSHCQTASSTSWGFPALPANLNPSNRPVRTRMPGGVAGDVELKLHAPMPICPPYSRRHSAELLVKLRPQPVRLERHRCEPNAGGIRKRVAEGRGDRIVGTFAHRLGTHRPQRI